MSIQAHHHVGVGQRPVRRVLVARLPVKAAVVLLPVLLVTDERRAIGQRLLRVHHRGERIVVHLDELQRVGGDVGALGDHRRDLLPLEAHLVGDEDRLRVTRQRGHPGQVVRLESLTGDDRHHAGERLRPLAVDRVDPGVGEGAPQEDHVQHPGQRDVLYVVSRTADEAVVLDPLPGMADALDLFFLSRHLDLLSWTGRLRPARNPSSLRPTGPLSRCSCSRCTGRYCRRSPSGSRPRWVLGYSPTAPPR